MRTCFDFKVGYKKKAENLPKQDFNLFNYQFRYIHSDI